MGHAKGRYLSVVLGALCQRHSTPAAPALGAGSIDSWWASTPSTQESGACSAIWLPESSMGTAGIDVKGDRRRAPDGRRARHRAGAPAWICRVVFVHAKSQGRENSRRRLWAFGESALTVMYTDFVPDRAAGDFPPGLKGKRTSEGPALADDPGRSPRPFFFPFGQAGDKIPARIG